MLNDKQLRLLATAVKRYAAGTYFDGMALALRAGHEARPARRLWVGLGRHGCVRKLFDEWKCMTVTGDGEHEVREWLRRRRASRQAVGIPPEICKAPGQRAVAHETLRRHPVALRTGAFCPTCGPRRPSSHPTAKSGWLMKLIRLLGRTIRRRS